MGDKCDKQLKLGIFVFAEETHERKSWKLLDVRPLDLF